MLFTEQAAVGDKLGVQGRWQQQFSQMVSTILRDQLTRLELDSFNSLAKPDSYREVPGIAGINVFGQLQCVVELKTHWTHPQRRSGSKHPR